MKKEMTFEAAGTELDAILAELSDSETPLDRSLVLYARAAEHGILKRPSSGLSRPVC